MLEVKFLNKLCPILGFDSHNRLLYFKQQQKNQIFVITVFSGIIEANTSFAIVLTNSPC